MTDQRPRRTSADVSRDILAELQTLGITEFYWSPGKPDRRRKPDPTKDHLNELFGELETFVQDLTDLPSGTAVNLHDINATIGTVHANTVTASVSATLAGRIDLLDADPAVVLENDDSLEIE